jgi:hypothetical protein
MTAAMNKDLAFAGVARLGELLRAGEVTPRETGRAVPRADRAAEPAAERVRLRPSSHLGSMAERVVIDPQGSVPLPPDTDVVTVAAAMNPALSSWIALRNDRPVARRGRRRGRRHRLPLGPGDRAQHARSADAPHRQEPPAHLDRDRLRVRPADHAPIRLAPRRPSPDRR